MEVFEEKRRGNKNKPQKQDLPTEENVKKPFDKKTYRLKKYSNKYKLEQWEEMRKKRLMRDYYKEMKNDPMAGTYKPKAFDDDTQDVTDFPAGRFVRHPDLIEKEEKKKKDPYFKAKEKYEKVKQEKLDKKKEIERIKAEKQVKLAEYKMKKADRFKKLSKKTKKGQPVMTGRLELLLDKIEKSK